MKLHLFPCALIAAALSLVGCIDQDQKFIVNPDGSGKFVVNTTVDDSQLAALGAGTAGQDVGKLIALQLLKGTQGIEAWSDLKAEKLAGGKTKVTGTGYFPDLNKLKMSAGELGGGAQSSTLISKKEGDNWVIEFGIPDAEGAEAAAAGGAKKSPEEVTAEVKQFQLQWQSTKALVAPLFDAAKIGTSLQVGGTIKETLGFAKEGESQATLHLTGGKVVTAIDKLVEDPQLLEDAIASGNAQSVFRDPKRILKLVVESMTDGKGLPKVVITPGDPVFDYKKEVAAAKANPSDALKKLQAEAASGANVIRPPAGR